MAHTILNDARQKVICDALRTGHFMVVACALGGITKETYRVWCKRGREEAGSGSIYDKFNLAVLEASAQAENDALQVVREAAHGWTEISTETDAMGNVKTIVKKGADWQAAMKFLMHRFQDRWGYKATIELVEEANTGRQKRMREPEERALLPVGVPGLPAGTDSP